MEKNYRIWRADLNSLYDDQPGVPVVYDDRHNLWSAMAASNALFDNVTASWVTDKRTGETVFIASGVIPSQA